MLRLQKVTKRYKDTVVLNNVSYSFPETGLVCVVGPSGQGKTTLLNLLAGFDTAYEGDIFVDQTSLRSLSAKQLCDYRRQKVGFVFQDYCLISGYSIMQNVTLAARFSNESEQSKRLEAAQLLKRLGMENKAQRRADSLSGGQKQRVALARALMGNPCFIMADEPTGSLDRKASQSIMELFRDISAERLVILITHDEKLLPFADEVLRMEQGSLIAEDAREETAAAPATTSCSKVSRGPAHPFKRALLNFNVHKARLMVVACIMAIGMAALLLSLSSGSLTQQAISKFKEQNTVYNNGYIKGADTDGSILKALQNNQNITQAYEQYTLHDVSLSVEDQTQNMEQKLPLPKATESLSYGNMPREGMNEIALSPSLAKKFSSNIQTLLGKPLSFSIQGINYTLTVCGIYNAGYDDFFVSSDVERELYRQQQSDDVYAISYDVDDFDNVVAVSEWLQHQGLQPQDAANEVKNLQDAFINVQRLFWGVSALVGLVAIFLCVVLLLKLQHARYREVGLLAALGFYPSDIALTITFENVLLALLTAAMGAVFTGAALGTAHVAQVPLSVEIVPFALSVLAVLVMVMIIGSITSLPLLKADPAKALRS